MYKIIILFFSFFIVISGVAQDMSNSAVVEQHSEQLYSDENWTKLTEYGNKAIAAGYDYFYLRQRVGAAYYNQKKYMQAVTHFEKALKFNSSDKLTLEYLYYTYIFLGRTAEARALTVLFPVRLKYLLKPPKNKIIESIYTEGGVALSNLNDSFKNISIDAPANTYGEATITKNMQYWHIGLNHQLGHRWSVYHGYSNIKIDLTRDIKIADKDTLDNYKLTQHDYYIGLTGQFRGIAISPAFHFINVNFGKLNAGYNLINSTYLFKKKDTTFINYATSISLAKTVGIFSFNLTSGFAQLNGLTQFQEGFSLSYYPLKNTNFVGTTSIVYLNEDTESRFIEIQKFGFKIIPKLWAEAGIYYGNLQNYCENNAFVVFNTSDKILYKCDFSITCPLLKHFEFSLRYDYFSKENLYYRTNNINKIEPATVNYNTQTIIGGVKWNI